MLAVIDRIFEGGYTLAPIQFSAAALFDGFPEPVALLREGVVRYKNPACARLFPGMEAGRALPEVLGAALAEACAPAVVCARLEGRSWRMSLQETEAGTLLILRLDQDTPLPPRMDRLTGQLRQETAGLAMALQRLDPSRPELDPDRAKQYLAVANQGIHRLLRLCDHLEFLDHETFRPAPMDLAAFVGDLARQVEGVCRAGGWAFRYESDAASVFTTADGELLRRLILSLISNAMKAAEPGGNLGLKLTLRGKRALLTVWDGGPGVEAENFSRLFEGGSGGPALDPKGSLGLGLDAVRRIAALHGGAVMVESQPGHGLRGLVALPIRPPEAGELRLRSPRAQLGGFSPLLVELSDVLPAALFAPEELEN